MMRRFGESIVGLRWGFRSHMQHSGRSSIISSFLLPCREAQAVHPETQRADYRVIVHTAGGPGFVDSAVTATLRSPSNSEHKLHLCPGGGPVPAAAVVAGHEDIFLLKGVPVSSVAEVALAVDTSADAATWFLQWFRVINCITGEARVFAATALFGPAATHAGAQQTLELTACSEVLDHPCMEAARGTMVWGRVNPRNCG